MTPEQRGKQLTRFIDSDEGRRELVRLHCKVQKMPARQTDAGLTPQRMIEEILRHEFPEPSNGKP